MKRLTAKLVDAINRPGKYHDGDAGLYLYVQEGSGRLRKSYVQRVTVHGRRVEIGLRSAAHARKQANECVRLSQKLCGEVADVLDLAHVSPLVVGLDIAQVVPRHLDHQRPDACVQRARRKLGQ